MDKSCQFSADSSTPANNNNTLKSLNKLSHKISKPTIKKPTFDPPQNIHSNPSFNTPQPQPHPPSQPPPQQHQPPVYNINKNDFRDVVQKLTGSPAHERISTPPPIQPPKPPSSRLQRIRPPPLAQITNRPPPLLNNPIPQPQPVSAGPIPSFSGFGRPGAPLSPLPPFPAVHAAAESPVSAYMRYLQNSITTLDSNQKQFSGFSPLAPLVSPRWNNFVPSQPLPEPRPQIPPAQQDAVPPSSAPAILPPQLQFQMPSSPLAFGCLNSPRSYPLLSPGILFSPTSGQLGFPQLPLSPTVPVPSTTSRGL